MKTPTTIQEDFVKLRNFYKQCLFILPPPNTDMVTRDLVPSAKLFKSDENDIFNYRHKFHRIITVVEMLQKEYLK